MDTVPQILLVDDDSSVRQSVARVLHSEGFNVIAACDGREALGFIESQPIDLVLLDLNMPQQNGWETLQGLSTRAPSVPIIIITARSNQLFQALAAGAAALMEKPLDFPKLLKTARDLLAEPLETRLARTAGRNVQFHYLPATSK
jgi:two-component system chemotaxis response regulator CheY